MMLLFYFTLVLLQAETSCQHPVRFFVDEHFCSTFVRKLSVCLSVFFEVKGQAPFKAVIIWIYWL